MSQTFHSQLPINTCENIPDSVNLIMGNKDRKQA